MSEQPAGGKRKSESGKRVSESGKRVSENGKRVKFWNEQRREQLRGYIEAGHTSVTAAALLGISRDSVTGCAARMKLRWKGGEAIKRKPKTTKPTEHQQWLENKKGFPPRGYCLFPLGDPKKEDFAFCGEKITDFGHAYCNTHQKMCFHSAARGG